MKLCTCFQRIRAVKCKILRTSRYYSVRSFYLTLLFEFEASIRGVKADLQCHLNHHPIYVNLTFVCVTYRSLYLLSALSLVSLCDLLFLIPAFIVPTCHLKEKSYLLQSYKTDLFQNAYIFSSKFAARIMRGLNVTHLIHLVLRKMRYFILQRNMCDGVTILINGRIISAHTMKTKMNALCVSSIWCCENMGHNILWLLVKTFGR